MTTEKGLGGGLRPDSAAPDSREPSAVLLNPTYQGENGNGKDLANGLVSGERLGSPPQQVPPGGAATGRCLNPAPRRLPPQLLSLCRPPAPPHRP